MLRDGWAAVSCLFSLFLVPFVCCDVEYLTCWELMHTSHFRVNEVHGSSEWYLGGKRFACGSGCTKPVTKEYTNFCCEIHMIKFLVTAHSLPDNTKKINQTLNAFNSPRMAYNSSGDIPCIIAWEVPAFLKQFFQCFAMSKEVHKHPAYNHLLDSSVFSRGTPIWF